VREPLRPLPRDPRPYDAVAAVTEQAAHFAGRVVVVYVQPSRLRRVRAERTVPALRFEQPRVLGVCHA